MGGLLEAYRRKAPKEEDTPASESQLVQAKQRLEKETSMALVGETADRPLSGMDRMKLGFASGGDLPKFDKKFREMYPQGDIKRVPIYGPDNRPENEREGAQQRLGPAYYRRDPSEQYARANPPGFNAADIGGFVGKEGPSMVSETAAMLLPGGKEKAAVTIAKGVLGSLVGEYGRQVVGGGDYIPDSYDRGRLAQTGIGSAIGGAVGKVLMDLPTNILKGAGAIGISEKGRAALKAGPGIDDFPGFTPGQVGASPLWRRVENVSAATASPLREFYDLQQDALAAAFKAQRDPLSKSNFLAELSKANKRQEQAIMRRFTGEQVQGIKTSPKRSHLKRDAQKGLLEWDASKNAEVNLRYEEAKKIAEPEFNLSKLQGQVAALKRGTQGVGSDGEMITLSAPPAEVQKIIDKILALDPNMAPNATGSATEQLKALQSELYDLSMPTPGTAQGAEAYVRYEHSSAKAIRGWLDDTLFNPNNSDPAFTAAWRKASNTAKERFRILETTSIRRLARSEDALISREIASPGRYSELNQLKRILPERRWANVKDAWKTDLVRDPYNMTAALKKFDPETLSVLASPAERKLLAGMGKSFDELKSIGYDQAVAKGSAKEAFEQVMTLDARGARAMTKDFVRQGKTKSFKASAIDWLFDNSLKKKGAHLVLDKDSLAKNVATLNEKGIGNLIRGETHAFLKNAEAITEALNLTSDAGASIAASARAMTIADAALPSTGWSKNALIRASEVLMESVGIGKIFTSKTGRRILLGSGAKKTVIGTEVGVLLDNFVRELKQEEGSAPGPDIGTPIDTNRSAIQNPDGSQSTERTITIESEGKHYNIPTIINGQEVSEDEAVDHFFKTGEHFGEFSSNARAVTAARNRTKAIRPARKRAGK